MSKSKGEFLTVSLLESKGYDPMAYRLFCLQSHYRRNLVFSWENLDNAQGAYNKLLLDLANEKGCYYLDVHSALMDENGVLPEAASPDGIHLNAPYYKNWFNYLKTHVA